MINKYKLHNIILNSFELEGEYTGIVVDTKDPGFKNDGKPLSRVRVSIPELTDGIATDKLPWYLIRQTVNDSPNSQSKIPPVGSSVVVTFPDKTIYNGVVSYMIVSHPPR